MERLDSWLAWFKCHKAAMGAFFLSLATIVGGSGTIYGSDDLVHAAAVLALIGGSLSGGGMMKSDEFYREKAKVLNTKLDRRNPDSLIPVQDLRKLLAEEEKPR